MTANRSESPYAAVTASFLGWMLDAFDFFLVVMTLTAIAKDFGTSDAKLAKAIARDRNHGVIREPHAFTQTADAFDPSGDANPWYYEMPAPGLNYRVPDLLCALGWGRLVPEAVLQMLGKFACGMHGSAFGLPRGRGRSPMNWSIITGHNRFITSLFRYTPGMDDGDILGHHGVGPAVLATVRPGPYHINRHPRSPPGPGSRPGRGP